MDYKFEKLLMKRRMTLIQLNKNYKPWLGLETRFISFALIGIIKKTAQFLQSTASFYIKSSIFRDTPVKKCSENR